MSQSYFDLIASRHSHRTYDGKPLRPVLRKKLEGYLETIDNPFLVPISFRVLDAKVYSLSSPVIVGEDAYLAAKAKRMPNYEVALGYAFEAACLYAESLGLGTVMLAGTLNRKTFEEAMEVGEDEALAVVSPVGVPAKSMSLREKAMRKFLGADKRKPFEELFFEGSFDRPLDKGSSGMFLHPLEAVRLAPSATNQQPWRLIIDGKTVHFYENKTYKDNPLGDIQRVDIGIALCHFLVVLREEGNDGTVVVEDPKLPTKENLFYICSVKLK